MYRRVDIDLGYKGIRDISLYGFTFGKTDTKYSVLALCFFQSLLLLIPPENRAVKADK
jgi:hypothetical protein